MKDNKAKDKVLGFLKENPNSAVEAMTKGTKLSYILVSAALKQLQNENLVEPNPDDGTFNVVSKKKEAQATETKTEKKAGEQDNELGPKLAPGQVGRNNDRYDFGTLTQLSKGRVVHAVVKRFIADNPKMSLSKVQEALNSKVIQVRFGIITELTQARSHTKNKRERYFLKDEEILKVAGVKAAVTNQWTHSMLLEFLKVAKKLGYKIQVSK